MRRALRAPLPILALWAACASHATPPTEPEGTPLEGVEQAIHEAVNRHRVAAGDGPLRREPDLDALARRHSRAMAAGEEGFGHGGVKQRFREAGRERAVGAFAENVSRHPAGAQGSVAEQALAVWLASADHRKNLEGRYGLTGIGAARAPDGEVFVTQVFARAR